MSYKDILSSLKNSVESIKQDAAAAANNAKNRKNDGDIDSAKTEAEIAKNKALEAKSQTNQAKYELRKARKKAKSPEEIAELNELIAAVEEMNAMASDAVQIAKDSYTDIGEDDPLSEYRQNRAGDFALTESNKIAPDNTPGITIGKDLVWNKDVIAQLQALRDNGGDIIWKNPTGKTIIHTNSLEEGAEVLKTLSNLGHLQVEDALDLKNDD
ncbi:MAG: hypothetical protein H6850_02595 [Alphaproteobacteria bacterium]|nr:MAG: hypothetical protein H6850_02595 [Alphaproteobacteria bacterium]